MAIFRGDDRIKGRVSKGLLLPWLNLIGGLPPQSIIADDIGMSTKVPIDS